MVVIAIVTTAVVIACAIAGGIYLFLGRGVRAGIVGPLVFGVIGLTLPSLGALIAWDYYQFLEHASSAVGRVLSVDERTERDKDGQAVRFYSPRVSYRTAQGSDVEFTGPSSHDRDYAQGDSVEVLYLAEDPGGARVKTFPWPLLVAAVLAAMGTVFLGLAWRARK